MTTQNESEQPDAQPSGAPRDFEDLTARLSADGKSAREQREIGRRMRALRLAGRRDPEQTLTELEFAQWIARRNGQHRNRIIPPQG